MLTPPSPLLLDGFSFGGCLWKIVPELFEKDRFRDADTHDVFWMKEALVESMKSVGLCNPNPAVGCVIVKDGREISRGHTQHYGGKHAERHAFDLVSDPSLLKGATAYVTLEPCSHHGNQPPCAELLAASGLERIVIAREDPDARVCGRGVHKLIQARKKVTTGVLAPEATAWNYPFFVTATRTQPFFALKWAQTLDGQLADDEGTSQWISGSATRRYTHWLRQKYDGVLVGAGTFLKDASSLTVRDSDVIQRQPLRLIYDPLARLLEATGEARKKLLQPPEAGGQAYIVFVKDDDARSRLEKAYRSAIPVVVSGENIAEEIESGLRSTELLALHGRRVQSVLIEGGPRTLTELLRVNRVDLAHVFIAPIVTGGKKNRIAPGLTLAGASSFRNLATRHFGGDVLLEMVPLCSQF